MIKNERQYRISNANAAAFREALAQESEDRSHDDPIVARAMRDGIASQLQSLEYEIVEYERLRSGESTVIQAESWADLPRALINPSTHCERLNPSRIGDIVGTP